MTTNQNDSPGVEVLHCPNDWCEESWQFDPTKLYGRERAKIDAAMHYVETHGGKIPDEANFGHEQCPECHEILGLNGTVSCSYCGYIPRDARLVPQEGTNAH